MVNSSEKSETPSDKDDSKKIRFKLPDWFNITVWLGLIGVLAFSTSWMYVRGFSAGLNLDLARYFETIDYVQITPAWGITFIGALSAFIVALTMGALIFFRSACIRARLSAVGLIAIIITLCLVFIYQHAKCRARGITRLPPSEVFLKSNHLPIQGHVVFALNRYLLVYEDLTRSLRAIPQTEIQTIQTNWGQLHPSKGGRSKGKSFFEYLCY